jgi:heat shock protein HslJ
MMEQEAAVSALLSGSPTISQRGDTLTLTSSDHSAELARDQ